MARAWRLSSVARHEGAYWTTTSVPIGVWGQSVAAWVNGISTQPRLCGQPYEERMNPCSASPPLKYETHGMPVSWYGTPSGKTPDIVVVVKRR